MYNVQPEGRLILPEVKLNGGCQSDKFDWIKFEQPWAARRAKPMDGWSNGELQEVIRNPCSDPSGCDDGHKK